MDLSPVHSGQAPRPFSAELAIRKLHALGLTPARLAMERLQELRESSRILILYRKYFPQQYARSTASTVIRVLHDERGYSERELEFFTHVDRDLFPLPEFLFDSERLLSIPLYPQGVDWEDERENIRLSLRAAMALVSGEDDEAWDLWLPKDVRPDQSPRNMEAFESLCQRGHGLVRRIPLLFQFVTQGTGNLWLDTSWDQGWEDIPWEAEAMDHLSREWREARAFIARLDPLLDHIDKHPRYWLRRLVTLWNRAAHFDPATSSMPALM